MSIDSDSDKPIWTKSVTLLDAVPARADRARTGEKAALVAVEHDGEIEPPMMLNVADTKKLAVALLAVLAHHGDADAREV